MWLPHCHTRPPALTKVSKYKFTVHKTFTWRLFVCVQFSHCLIFVLWQVMHVLHFLSPIFYLLIYIQSLCLIIIHNASTYWDSFNYSKYMHCSPHKPLWFSISVAIPLFSSPLSNTVMYVLCCHGLVFSFIPQNQAHYTSHKRSSLCRRWIKWFWVVVCHAVSLFAIHSQWHNKYQKSSHLYTSPKNKYIILEQMKSPKLLLTFFDIR